MANRHEVTGTGLHERITALTHFGKPLDVASQDARSTVDEDQDGAIQENKTMPQCECPGSPGSAHIGKAHMSPGGEIVTNEQSKAIAT
eukprot:Skav211346  [mRNA]  locus=scaffold1797:27811:32782:+ [translate_table: standard]